MFLVVIIALLWLLHRATRLLKIPAPALIHVLGIDIPESPKVVIDSISSTSVLLHWPLPEKGSVVKYIIEVNGRKIGEADRSDSVVTLKDLVSDTNYTIKVVAVNPSNYRSHAAKILIHTLKNDDDTLPVYPGLLVPGSSSSSNLGTVGDVVNGSLVANGVIVGETNNNITATSTNVTGATPTSASTSSATTTSSNRLRSASRTNIINRNDRSLSNGSSFRSQSEKSAYSIESLTHEVESVQIEINDLLAQAAHGEEEFLAAEKELLNELEQLKSRKKTVDQQRSHIRSETKSLEDSKRSLETQKSKVDARFKKIQDEFSKRASMREKWANDIQRAQSKLVNVESSLELIDEEGHKNAEELELIILQKQEQLSSLEEELKKIASASRKAEFRKTATVEQVQNIQKNTDPVTGIVKDEAINELMDNPDVDNEVKKQFKEEIDKDKELEVEWQRIQKNLEVRYLTASQQYREAHEAHNSAASAIQQQRQQQQSLNPINGTKAVVDSVNAAIAQKGKKKNRRKSNKNLQAPFGTIPSPYDLVVTNSSSPSIQSSTNDYYSSVSGSAISANNSILQGIPNQTVNLNESPSNSNAFTTTPINSVFPNTTQRTPPNNVDIEENPMSPSVDMLLPSNLFGTDDLTESFAAIINDLPRTRDQRASASMLAGAFGNRPPSLGDSSASPKPSLLSLQDNTPSSPGVVPSSPQDNYSAFSGFPGSSSIGMGAYNGSVHSLVDEDNQKKQPQNTAKKFSSMFFFSKPKRDGDKDDTTDNNTSNNLNGNSSSFLDVGPIGTRPRAGSYNSAHSLGISSLHGSTHGSNFFNPWNDMAATISPTTSASGIIPQVSSVPVSIPLASGTSDIINSTTTANTSTIPLSSPLFSSDNTTTYTPTTIEPSSTPKSKGFVGSGMWSVFNRDRERERASSSLKNDISIVDSSNKSPTNSPSGSWPDMPMLLVSNSRESRPESLGSHISNGAISRTSVASTHTTTTGPLSNSGGNKFSKSFAELFSSSNKEQQSAPPPPSRSRSESKSIAQLFGAKSEAKPEPKIDESDLSASVESKESLNKESILQKSMRTFSTSRKGSSSSSSSKFVRRLSIFGKKGEQRELSDGEDTPDQTILEDSEDLIEE